MKVAGQRSKGRVAGLRPSLGPQNSIEEEDMNYAVKAGEHLLRHFFAAFLSLPFPVLIWAYVNPAVEWVLTEEYSSAGLHPDSGMFVCCCSLFYLFFFAVLSSAFDLLLVEILHWKFWLHIPTFAVSVFLITCTVSLWIGVLAGPIDFRGLFTIALDSSLWGIVYWGVFVLSGRIFLRWVRLKL